MAQFGKRTQRLLMLFLGITRHDKFCTGFLQGNGSITQAMTQYSGKE